jgi:hypothetical protein
VTRLTKKKASPKEILQLLGNGPMSVPGILAHFGASSIDGDGSEIWMSIHFLHIRDQIVSVDGQMTVAASGRTIVEEAVLDAMGADRMDVPSVVRAVHKRFRTVPWLQADTAVRDHMNRLLRAGRIVRKDDAYAVVREAEIVMIPETSSVAAKQVAA